MVQQVIANLARIQKLRSEPNELVFHEKFLKEQARI